MSTWKEIVGPRTRTPVKVSPDFVQTNLEGFAKRKSTNSWFIICPFHSDTDPSLSVIVSPTHRMKVGNWKCFGCGKFGDWNDLAKALNLPIVEPDGIYVNDIEEEGFVIEDNPEDELVEELKTGKEKRIKLSKLLPWPNSRKWRGFSGDFIQKHGGKLYKLDGFYPLIFPCLKRNKKQIIGAIRCRLKKKKGYLSYLFTSEEWISNYFFPEEYLKPTKIVVMVEGVRDNFGLIRNGIPSLATLGTSPKITEKRIATLTGLGIEKVVIFMDGDDPGKKASLRIREELVEDFGVKIFKTWKYFPGKDPYKLSKNRDFVSKFKKLLR